MRSKRSLLLGAIFCLSFSLALVASDNKTSRADLSAAQIVEKNIAARGGLQAWRAVQAMSWAGRMDAGGGSINRSRRMAQHMPGRGGKVQLTESNDSKSGEVKQAQLPFVLEMKRSHKSRVEIQFAGKTAVQVYDGTNGWKVRPYLNRNDVEPFTAEELKLESGRGELDGPLVDYAAKGTKVEFEAVEPVEGHDAYKLKLTTKTGDVQHVWIDKESFLDVKIDGEPRRMDGRTRNVWIYQRDFRTVQGLKVPFVLETAVDGFHETHKMMIEKVEVNPKLTDDLFAKPKA
jgi:outer membrane lipoprotein-sorting protein